MPPVCGYGFWEIMINDFHINSNKDGLLEPSSKNIEN
jgi:hypothetical protein